MKHQCYGNWEPGKNCRACMELESCKGSTKAPDASKKPVKKTVKRLKPKKQEYATPDKAMVDAYGNTSLDEG